MPINWLFEQPLIFLAWIVAIVVSLTIHELAHGLTAKFYGDETAENQGRLTLNPIAHIDWIGFAMLLLVGFGWAKPVMVNPNSLRNRKLGMFMVSLMGPAINFILAIIFGVILKLVIPYFDWNNLLVNFLMMMVLVNLLLGLFNLLPIPPLDGSNMALAVIPEKFSNFREKYVQYGPIILLGLVLLDSFSPVSIFGSLFGGILDFVTSLF
jgi:Zn-dependent protease